MVRPYEQRFPWNLDWNLLRTFMVIVEQRGLSKAADVLGLKQPTISSALKRLEETVGHKLLDRKPNRFFVTRAGAKLYAECSTIFGAVREIPVLLDADEEEVTGHIGIVMASHVTSPHFDKFLEEFSSRNPKVTYSIVVAESADVVGRIRQNHASFGVCLLSKEPKSLESTVLFREYFALYCGSQHPLFGRENVRDSEISGEPSVSFQTEIEGGPLAAVARLRERAQLAPGLRGISSNLPEVRRMIVANIGIGALPIHVAERDVQLGLLWQMPPYTDLPAVDIFLLSNPKKRSNQAEALFIEELTAQTNSLSVAERTYTTSRTTEKTGDERALSR